MRLLAPLLSFTFFFDPETSRMARLENLSFVSMMVHAYTTGALLVVLPCCSFTLAGWQCIRTVVVSRSNSNTTTYSKYIVFKDFMQKKEGHFKTVASRAS
jgi:hypothetical protein